MKTRRPLNTARRSVVLVTWIRKVGADVAQFFGSERGLTTVEYAMAGALVAVALVVAFINLGGTVGLIIGDMTSALNP